MSTAIDMSDRAGSQRQLANPMQTWFSTESVPPARRVAEWEAHHAAALVGLRTRWDTKNSLRAEAATLSLRGLRVAKVAGNPHTVRRQAQDIAAHPAPGAIAYFPLHTVSEFNHRTGQMHVGPGKAILCDGDSEFSRDLSRGVEELVIHIPRDLLCELTGSVSIRRPGTIDLRQTRNLSTAAQELSTIAKGALHQSIRHAEQFETRLVDLLSTLLCHSAIDYSIIELAFRAITDLHRDPDFNASRLARHAGISERHLSRLFAESGQSIPRAILTARLDTAHRILSDPSAAEASMAEVAAASGFRSQAQFARTYGARFCISPLRHRRQLLNLPAEA